MFRFLLIFVCVMQQLSTRWSISPMRVLYKGVFVRVIFFYDTVADLIKTKVLKSQLLQLKFKSHLKIWLKSYSRSSCSHPSLASITHYFHLDNDLDVYFIVSIGKICFGHCILNKAACTIKYTTKHNNK